MGADWGRTGGLRQTGEQADIKGEADRRTGGGWVDGRTARRMEADRQTSGQVDESRRGVDRAD